jgi:hypothetical protein
MNQVEIIIESFKNDFQEKKEKSENDNSDLAQQTQRSHQVA